MSNKRAENARRIRESRIYKSNVAGVLKSTIKSNVDDTEVDIRKCNIFDYCEHLFRDTVEVRIQFTDTGSTVNNKSLLEGLPLVGTEDFSFEIQDALEQKLKMDLIVNKVTPLNQDTKKQEILLNMTSEEFIRNEQISSSVKKRYDGKIDAHVKEILKDRILVLDGAMGTMIQRYNLTEEDFRGNRFKSSTCDLKGNNDILSITRPRIIKEIHAEFLNAGADILETNTFSGTSIAQADYNLESAVYDINYQSAKIAKEIAKEFSSSEKPRFVAGAIGPTNRTSSISPDVENPAFRHITFDQLKVAYTEQIEALICLLYTSDAADE